MEYITGTSSYFYMVALASLVEYTKYFLQLENFPSTYGEDWNIYALLATGINLCRGTSFIYNWLILSMLGDERIPRAIQPSIRLHSFHQWHRLSMTKYLLIIWIWVLVVDTCGNRRTWTGSPYPLSCHVWKIPPTWVKDRRLWWGYWAVHMLFSAEFEGRQCIRKVSVQPIFRDQTLQLFWRPSSEWLGLLSKQCCSVPNLKADNVLGRCWFSLSLGAKHSSSFGGLVQSD